MIAAMRGAGDLEDLCGRMVGEFVLRERIDEGGFGAVYRCEQPLLGREAVVKVLHQRLRRNDVLLQRFMREAQLASRLDHPYAAHVYAFGIEHDDGLFWIAMEMVQGITLNKWLRDRGPLPLDQFVPFFERVAEVVQTAHDRGIVHRDLKPSNVMVMERAGRLLPKLLDFGIAKLLDDAVPPLAHHDTPRARPVSEHDGSDISGPVAAWVNPSEVVTLTGATVPPPRRGGPQRLTHGDVTVGSPPYMSPEQWSNARTVGPASDLYALGVLGFEALTGRRPFHAPTVAEYVELHCHAPVPPLGERFSPALDRVFSQALAKLPEDRFGSALELAAAFRTASGIGITVADLPKLDDAVREAWLADAPQPLAESIAALEGARNVHQARDAAQEAIRNLLRYVLALALATRAQVREDRGGAALLELVRTMRRRDLGDDERIWLIRLLVRPLMDRRGAHPIPELVDLVTPYCDNGPDGLEPLIALNATSDHGGAEGAVRARLARLVPELTQLLRRTSFVLDYVLVVPHAGAPERWTGLRRQHRALVTIRSGELVRNHPMLLDRESRICVDAWPLMQTVAPSEGAELELFLFDGRGRHGARLIAAPVGFEHHDPSVWEWISTHVIAELEPTTLASEEDQPPYLGLRPFSRRDAARFVGREAEVEAFVNRLRLRPMQVVVGPSGAGKSSFVNAGVIPALPPTWRAITLRPGSAPIRALAAQLHAAGFVSGDLRGLLETAPAEAAAQVAAAAVALGTLVIVIDQLEELFTLCASADERLQFARVIAQLAASSDAPIRVIGAIRDDFLMQLDALPPLHALLSPALVLLGNPSRDTLVRIVVEPAARADYVLSDPELAHDMVSVVANRPGALALLSFTASRLWELRDRRFRQLTRSAYDAMGGVGGALGRHAEATLDQMSADEQRLVREIFRHLVTAEGTRAQITLAELRQRLATPRADAVIDKLVAARLIAVSESDGDAQVEMIHEALIDAWPRLRDWVREDIDGARMRDQIRAAARQWQDRARPKGLLWRDDMLADLERWLRRSDAPALSELEAAFVEASRRDTRRVKRARRVLALVAFGIVVAFGAFQYLARQQTRVARELAETRLTQSYVEQGRQALLSGKYGEAMVYFDRAARRGDDSPSTQFMLARAAQPLLAEKTRLTTPSGRMWSAMFSPDGQRIVTTDDAGARIWDARTSTLLFLLPHTETVASAAFSPDGSKLYTAGSDGVVKVWHASSGALVQALTQRSTQGERLHYYGLAVSPDGGLVAAIDPIGARVTVWNASTGAVVQELSPGSSMGLPSLAFSQDSRWLAVSGTAIQVLDTRSWQVALTLAVADVVGVAFDPTGARLAVVTNVGDVSIWAVPSGTRIHHLQDRGPSIKQVAFSPDGATIVTGHQDGTARLWSSQTGHMLFELKNHRGAIRWAEFDAESKLVVTAASDGVVSISDVTTGMPVASFEGSQAPVMTAHFDPRSRRVISASWDGTARVWSAPSPYRRWISPAIDSDCASDASLDEDRRFIAISCPRHGTYIWDTAHDKLLAELPGVASAAVAAPAFPAISPAGDFAAVAAGNTVAIYDLSTRQQVLNIRHPAAVTAIAFTKTGHDVISGSTDGAVLLTRAGYDSIALPAFPDGISVVGFAPDGRAMAASTAGRLRIYAPAGATQLADIDLAITPRSFRTSSDGRRLIVIPSSVKAAPPVLVDLENLGIAAQLVGHKGQVFSARFVGGDREILTAGSDGIARRWDGATGKLLQTYLGSSQYLLDAALNPDGSIIVTAGGDGVLRFWDVFSGKMIWALRIHNSTIGGLHFEGADIVARGFSGGLSRWALAPPASQTAIRELVRCLPLRFDDDAGRPVEQQACDTIPDKASD